MIFGTGVLMRGKGASGGRSDKAAAMESLVWSILGACGEVDSLCGSGTSTSGSAVWKLSATTGGPAAAAVASTPSSQRQLEFRAAVVEVSSTLMGACSSNSSCGKSGSSLRRLRTLCAWTWRETWRRQSCDGIGSPEQAQVQSLPHRGQAILVLDSAAGTRASFCTRCIQHAKFSDSDEFPPQCLC